MNVLQSNAPEGQVYNLQTTNQGTLEVELVPGGTGGVSFTDSVSANQSTSSPPLVAIVTADPAEFGGVVINGWVTLSWVNNESEDASIGGSLTFEGSLDSGVTFSSIGDPVSFQAWNPSTASVQQIQITIPVVFRSTGPATGGVEVRATVVDNSSGAAFGNLELTVAAVYTNG